LIITVHGYVNSQTTEKTASKAVVSKETKLIPPLVFVIEKFDLAVTKYASKKKKKKTQNSKTLTNKNLIYYYLNKNLIEQCQVSLTKGWKNLEVRDLKIQKPTNKRAIDEDGGNENAPQQTTTTTTIATKQPPTKKAKPNLKKDVDEGANENEDDSMVIDQ